MNAITNLFQLAARADRLGIAVTRIGLVVVLVWIGSLKVFNYEDEGIVPLVVNSPFMSFFLPATCRRVSATYKPGRRIGSRQPGMA